MKDLFLKDINLQRFAEGTEPEAENSETETEEQQGQEESKTYTQEEVDKMLEGLMNQEQVNEVLEKRLARERKKKEEEIQEAERLAKLSQAEREKELNEKTKQELEEAKATIRRMNLEHDTEKILVEKSLPLEFKAFLIGEDEESTNENIKAFEATYQKAIENGVNERLKTGAPRAGGTTGGIKNPWSKEDFNLTEQGRIMREDPELAKKLQNI